MDIYRLEVVDYCYPLLTLDVVCSAGTYIRSLGRDLARSLGTSAAMSALVRTAVGSFTMAGAIDPTALTPDSLTTALRSPLEAIPDMPALQLDETQRERIARGMTIPLAITLTGVAGLPGYAGEYKALDESGRLVALLAERAPGMLGPVRNFPQS